MRWISCLDSKLNVSTYDALFNSVPKKDDLWIPENIPLVSDDFLDNITNYTDKEIAYYIINIFFSDLDNSEVLLKNVINKAFNFDTDLHKLEVNDYILELFHGPTMAFKDYGARILANLYSELVAPNKKLLVATSGDTGAAVADAFSFTSIPVYIFYPKNKVSNFQERQITRHKNIVSFCVNGNFDDCQKIVKNLLCRSNNFITANSINIARLIPQISYYFIAYKRLLQNKEKKRKIILSVPSGNMGNVTSAMISKKMGLPFHKIILATNINDSVPLFLKSGVFTPKISKETLSNAMDVGNPSNFSRMISLFTSEWINKNLKYKVVTDIETEKTINNVYVKYKYILDPHSAVSYKASESIRSTNDDSEDYVYISVATASPYKFKDIVEKSINKKLDYPYKFNKLLDLTLFKVGYPSISEDLFIKLKTIKKIVLIGMPGSGKTTIANKLMFILKTWTMINTDDIIIKKYKKDLIHITDEYGDKFQNIEEETILNLDIKENTIVSPGGSIVYCEKAMNFLKDRCIIIYLYTDSDILKNRLGDYSKRGIVFKEGESFLDLYKKRHKLYNKYRDITIDNSNHTLDETCNIIKNLL